MNLREMIFDFLSNVRAGSPEELHEDILEGKPVRAPTLPEVLFAFYELLEEGLLRLSPVSVFDGVYELQALCFELSPRWR